MAIATYRFSSVSDAYSYWTDIQNAIDNDTSTSAYSTTNGKYLKFSGTNAPTSGGTITKVELYASLSYKNIGSGSLETIDITSSPPVGGWTWEVLNSLKADLYGNYDKITTGNKIYIRLIVDISTIFYTFSSQGVPAYSFECYCVFDIYFKVTYDDAPSIIDGNTILIGAENVKANGTIMLSAPSLNGVYSNGNIILSWS